MGADIITDTINTRSSIDLRDSLQSATLIISLRGLVEEFLAKPENELFGNAYGLITESEAEALELIQSGEYSDIIIRKEGSSDRTTIKRPTKLVEQKMVVQKLRLRLIFNDYSELRIMKGKSTELILKNQWS